MRYLWLIVGLFAELALASSQQGFKEAIIAINGVRNTYQANQQVVVFQGDLITIEKVSLWDGSSPSLVNLIGFRNSQLGNPFDDRLKPIRIDQDLSTKWSRNGTGKQFDIIVSSHNIRHGYLYLKVEKAAVESIELTISNRKEKVKSGEIIKMSKSDNFKLEHVNANFDINDNLFRYEILTPNASPKLVFERNGVRVATFPIELR